MEMTERSRLGSGVKGITMMVVAVLATASCSTDPTEPPAHGAFQVQAAGADATVHVMTQNVVQDAVMDAYFEGAVDADDDGCLRLAREEGPTVVWPVAYRGEATPEGTSILDGDGTEVGKVDGSFSFGGGSVPELLEALGFSEEDRDLAEELCPGRYWIVAP